VIQVKKLQALCYWVRDQQKHGQGITQDDWDDNTVMAMIKKMRIEKGRDTAWQCFDNGPGQVQSQ
jgi:hypothetical protein